MTKLEKSMYELISVTALELEITESFFPTWQKAHDAMVADMILMTEYKDMNEIIDAADAGLCGFSDDGAWAETLQCGTGQWKIVKVPETV